jgi:hypothetical protein
LVLNLSFLAALVVIDRATLAALVCGLAGVAIFVARRGALRGTTLTAAWCWGLVSFALLATTIVASGLTLPDSPAELRPALYFAALMTTFCPVVAMLGAKRPQHRAWQWIVLSLWIVLALPAGEWLLFATRQEVHPARGWFLVVLIALGALNYLPTRSWLAALLFAAGQVALLSPFLPLIAQAAPLPRQLGLGLIVAALAASAAWPRGATPAEPLDRLWRDFRNLFGAVWALRVAERMNAAAVQNGWPVRLTWAGFQSGDSPGAEPIAAETREPVAKTFRSLLLPFTSPEWIADRLDPRSLAEQD